MATQHLFISHRPANPPEIRDNLDNNDSPNRLNREETENDADIDDYHC